MQFLYAKRTGVVAISLLSFAGFQSAGAAQGEPDGATKEKPSEEARQAHEHEHEHKSSSHEGEHDGHDHSQTQDHEEDIYAGYFDDSQVEDRSLSDWEGDWQSVYPYLKDGTLDEVFAHKAEQDDKKTAEDYKQYYEIGYQTDADRIVIQGDEVTFYRDGSEVSGKYNDDGYEILTYQAGNRGVRYSFELEEGDAEAPQFIQFSDHSIFPTQADHFHLYWGDNREALLEEVTNWPTYYPSDMDGHDITHEMIAH